MKKGNVISAAAIKMILPAVMDLLHVVFMIRQLLKVVSFSVCTAAGHSETALS